MNQSNQLLAEQEFSNWLRHTRVQPNIIVVIGPKASWKSHLIQYLNGVRFTKGIGDQGEPTLQICDQLNLQSISQAFKLHGLSLDMVHAEKQSRESYDGLSYVQMPAPFDLGSKFSQGTGPQEPWNMLQRAYLSVAWWGAFLNSTRSKHILVLVPYEVTSDPEKLKQMLTSLKCLLASEKLDEIKRSISLVLTKADYEDDKQSLMQILHDLLQQEQFKENIFDDALRQNRIFCFTGEEATHDLFEDIHLKAGYQSQSFLAPDWVRTLLQNMNLFLASATQALSLLEENINEAFKKSIKIKLLGTSPISKKGQAEQIQQAAIEALFKFNSILCETEELNFLQSVANTLAQIRYQQTITDQLQPGIDYVTFINQLLVQLKNSDNHHSILQLQPKLSNHLMAIIQEQVKNSFIQVVKKIQGSPNRLSITNRQQWKALLSRYGQQQQQLQQSLVEEGPIYKDPKIRRHYFSQNNVDMFAGIKKRSEKIACKYQNKLKTDIVEVEAVLKSICSSAKTRRQKLEKLAEKLLKYCEYIPAMKVYMQLSDPARIRSTVAAAFVSELHY